MQAIIRDHNPQSRPYRSHKVPACIRCRQRKARCTAESIDQPCLLCRLNDATCQREQPRNHTQRSFSRGSRRQRRRQASTSENNTFDQSTHVIGPIIAQDMQVVSEYLSQGDDDIRTTQAQLRPNPYNVYSDDPIKPVLYMKVPRRREGLSNRTLCTDRDADSLEKLVQSSATHLVSLFFEKFHTCFPVLRHEMSQRDSMRSSSPALKSEVYAIALIYWHQSSQLQRLPRPDIRYVWNLAVGALHEEFLAPDFNSLVAAVLDLSGRPIYSITGNALNLGRSIALAHTLGLNRDPSKWQLPDNEKELRILVWWAVLIHDRWASISHGTPPLIQIANYDVPIPNIQMLVPSNEHCETRLQAAQCYIELCRLTEILGEILPSIFELQTSPKHNGRNLNTIETILRNWSSSLPSWLVIEALELDALIPGAKNLQLSYFAVRIYLCRLALQSSTPAKHLSDSTLQSDLLSKCQSAAKKVSSFVSVLSKKDLDAFWLPYAAYHFTSAATMLLRCCLVANNEEVSNSCFDDVKIMVSTLRRLKDEHDFDLGDICLAQCELAVKKMDCARPVGSARSQLQDSTVWLGATLTDNQDIESEEYSGVGQASQWHEDLATLFPNIWDMFQWDGSGVI